MLFGAAPVLMLMLPPQELSNIPESDRHMPGVSFFLMRMLLGAFAGILLLFLTSACTTYESIAESSEWGARLRMAAGNQPHEGIPQMLLMLCKLTAMLLLAVNMLCAARQTLELCIPRLAGKWLSLFLCAALLAVVLSIQSFAGDTPILLAAPMIAAGAALAAALPGRRQRR